ncbi:hypothetical protein J7337_005682 [Fusarium musae]|uniref:Uncharacterized protein n=1 Tax=Fusarium musae TaxID=1042133 RepID=A0A9P8DJ09_9HYPO|nr:hypothetical protein J7337_005682 [Fusarium musae]KAG9502847.1 hypothetical protein J7337_005682 [Fusarium musae]
MNSPELELNICDELTNVGIVMTAPGIIQRRGLETIDLKVTITDVLLGGSKLNMFDSRSSSYGPTLTPPRGCFSLSVSGVKLTRMIPPPSTKPKDKNSGIHTDDRTSSPDSTGPTS